MLMDSNKVQYEYRYKTTFWMFLLFIPWLQSVSVAISCVAYFQESSLILTHKMTSLSITVTLILIDI